MPEVVLLLVLAVGPSVNLIEVCAVPVHLLCGSLSPLVLVDCLLKFLVRLLELLALLLGSLSPLDLLDRLLEFLD